MYIMFQVSNWFINARVRLWKPMVEDMYQQELKEGEVSGEEDNREKNQSSSNNSGQLASAQTPTPSTTTASNTTTTPPATTSTTPTTPTGKRSDFNAHENDPSLTPIINRQTFSENQVNQQQQQHYSTTTTTTTTTTILATTASEVAPPVSDLDLPPPHNNRSMVTDDTCRRGSYVTAEYGTTSAASDIGSTLIRFGTTSGDVSLTLGLRHAGNLPEKNPFSLRDFGGI